MGGKGGSSPSIPKEFRAFAPMMEELFRFGMRQADPFVGGTLSSLSNVDNAMDSQAMRHSIAMGMAPMANVFGTSANALQAGLDGGFSQLPTDLMTSFGDQLRPVADIAHNVFSQSLMSDQASAGRSRSQGSVDAASRGHADIEGGFMQNVMGGVMQALPSILQAQLGGISQGLSIPGQIGNMLQPDIAEAFQGTQMGLGMPFQGAGGVQAMMAGLPINPGEQGKGKGDMAGNVIGLAGATAPYWGPMLACWTAREVYGHRNPKWIQFRNWILRHAPDSMRRIYLTTAPAVADFLVTNPTYKEDLRPFFDAHLVEV